MKCEETLYSKEILGLIEKYKATGEPLLTLLHEIQDLHPDNHLPATALKLISKELKMPVSTLYSTVSFYSMFSLKPRGRHIVRVCSSPPCKLDGTDVVLEALEKRLGIGVGETTPDRNFTLEEQSCLGVCSLSPVVMIDEDVFGNVTPQRLPVILESYEED